VCLVDDATAIERFSVHRCRLKTNEKRAVHMGHELVVYYHPRMNNWHVRPVIQAVFVT